MVAYNLGLNLLLKPSSSSRLFHWGNLNSFLIFPLLDAILKEEQKSESSLKFLIARIDSHAEDIAFHRGGGDSEFEKIKTIFKKASLNSM